MADERKRIRRQFVVLALLLWYPLSIGPIARLDRWAEYEGHAFIVNGIHFAYYPIIKLRCIRVFERMYLPYLACWVEVDPNKWDEKLEMMSSP